MVLLPPALKAPTAIFKPGFAYYKAAIVAPELVEAALVQTSLFDEPSSAKSQQLM
ncbi:hypothetical protein [Stenomitos frigidus]|uniref:hypothetical protein n=1 Tax=Stenomitos frigidus TaxID=1886765 RepID=UPI0015E7D16E|nr:hypothetical protein [Stenomitos frigidus]